MFKINFPEIAPYVGNETNALQRLIVHRPDEGIELVTPDKAMEYLYEDIVFLQKMKQEHDVFTKIIQFFIGKENIIDVQDLLHDLLKNERVKDDLIDAVCQFESIPDLSLALKKNSPAALTNILITGYDKKNNKHYFSPVSNLIFCRDIGVVIGENILVAEACKSARARESLLCRFIFKNHPLFRNNKIIEVSSFNTFLDNARTDNKTHSIEGGDVMLIHPKHLLVGHSERTTFSAIEDLAQVLFSRNAVETITCVSLPQERYCMHLDTIFTMIGDQECVAFEPLVCQPGKMKITQFHKGISDKKKYATLHEMLLTIFPGLTVVPCGGGISPYAEREQWTDGCNIFSIKQGVGITYDRNVHTAKALEKVGYKLLNARKLLNNFAAGKVKPEDVEKSIILIPSNELSRARGGTHCLTMPVNRLH